MGTPSSKYTAEFKQKAVELYRKSGSIEPSTVRSYRAEIKQICGYLGNTPLCDLTMMDP